jgi:hypothetical protein
MKITPHVRCQQIKKNLDSSVHVIPAEAGIQSLKVLLDSRLRGSDEICSCVDWANGLNYA